jgi:hypothetical protein
MAHGPASDTRVLLDGFGWGIAPMAPDTNVGSRSAGCLRLVGPVLRCLAARHRPASSLQHRFLSPLPNDQGAPPWIESVQPLSFSPSPALP